MGEPETVASEQRGAGLIDVRANTYAASRRVPPTLAFPFAAAAIGSGRDDSRSRPSGAGPDNFFVANAIARPGGVPYRYPSTAITRPGGQRIDFARGAGDRRRSGCSQLSEIPLALLTGMRLI